MEKIVPLSQQYSTVKYARAYIVRIALMLFPVPAFILFLLNVFFLDNLTIGFLELVVVLLSLFCLVILRRGWLNLSVTVFMASLSTMVSFICIFGDGINDLAILVYPLIVLFSSLIQKSNYVIGQTAYVIICLAVVIFGKDFGWYTPDDYGDGSYIDICIMVLILAFGSVLCFSLTSYITITVENVRKEIQLRKSMQEDIEKYLKEKTILLREVHHRIKNNLSLLNSLIDIESYEKKTDRTELQEFQKRIYSLSRVHDRLFRTEHYQIVEMNAFLDDLGQSFIQSGKFDEHQLLLNVETLRLDLYQALPVGIIFYEVINYVSRKSDHAALHVDLARSGEQIIFIIGSANTLFEELMNKKTLEAKFIEQMIRRLSGNRFLSSMEMRIIFPFQKESKPRTSAQSLSV